jgi:hypothetical protein
MEITFRMGDNEVTKEDFNLNKEYELFDVIYSISKNVLDNEVKAWTIIGHVLNSSANSRCFVTELCSYPISVFVSQNKHCTLESLHNDFVSRDRNTLIELKKDILEAYFEEQINKLK